MFVCLGLLCFVWCRVLYLYMICAAFSEKITNDDSSTVIFCVGVPATIDIVR